MPGVGTAVGGLLGGFMDGGMASGGGSSAAPQNSQTAVYGSGLDGSGWAVNFQGIQSASSTQKKADGIGLPDAGGGFAMPDIPMWVYAVAAGLILWKSRSKK